MNAPGGWRYGLLALPLAFVALPLYVQLPNHYARGLGVPLAALGAVLLAARLLDACADPWIGRLLDGAVRRSPAAWTRVAWIAAAVLAAGFALLVRPGDFALAGLLAWLLASLLVTYLAYSVLTVAHQAWGARLALDDVQRSRVFAWREGLGLLGVLLALLLPAVAGWDGTTVALALALAAGCAAWGSAQGTALAPAPAVAGHWRAPLADRRFRRLLAVFSFNGIASAVPATLVLFFIQDRLQAPDSWQPILLGAYFASGAVSMPLWVRLVARIGLARAWVGGMALAIAAFVGVAFLDAGDAPLFLVLCVLSGVALGSDLAIPSALLARLLADQGQGGNGALYFGWWNFTAKWNLALAAGLALPLLAALGYSPGEQTPAATQALVLVYVLLPCVLKAVAAALAHAWLIRGES